MPYCKLKTILLFIALGLSQQTVSANESQLKYNTTKVTDGIYMLSGVDRFTGGNIGLSVGDDGVVMIDDGIADVTEVLKATLAEISDKNIDYVINTHLHADHTSNNEAFSNEAKIISHDNVRTGLIKKERPADALPVLTFSDQMTIHLNGDAAKIIHFANAHTDGDAVIHFTKANVIHTGDILFHQRFPFVDSKNGGTLIGMIDALKAIHAMSDENTKIIPGHGALATKSSIGKNIEDLEDMYNTVKILVGAGKSDEEIAAAKPLDAYTSYEWGFITTDRMLTQIIANIRP